MDSFMHVMVSQFYEMIPAEDAIVFDGHDLKDGMVVLLENPFRRGTISETLLEDERELAVARMVNRWCVVSDIRFDMSQQHAKVAFIGTYVNGVQCKRVHHLDEAWLVKKHTVPESVGEMTATEKQLNDMADTYPMKSAGVPSRVPSVVVNVGQGDNDFDAYGPERATVKYGQARATYRSSMVSRPNRRIT